MAQDESVSVSTKEARVSRRQMIARGAAFSGIAMAGGGVGAAGATTSSTDDRLRIFEGKYSVGGAKLIDGYFAAPRGRTNLDVLVVIPGERGLDDAVRDLVRRHALAGKVALAPDLRKMGSPLLSRDAAIADFVARAPLLKKHARGNGTVRIVAA